MIDVSDFWCLADWITRMNFSSPSFSFLSHRPTLSMMRKLVIARVSHSSPLSSCCTWVNSSSLYPLSLPLHGQHNAADRCIDGYSTLTHMQTRVEENSITVDLIQHEIKLQQLPEFSQLISDTMWTLLLLFFTFCTYKQTYTFSSTALVKPKSKSFSFLSCTF